VEADKPCEYLQWDSDFFGLRIARVNGNRLSPARAAAISEWCVSNRIDCLYFLADAGDQETVKLAERDGYGFVDVRVTLGQGSGARGQGSVKGWQAPGLKHRSLTPGPSEGSSPLATGPGHSPLATWSIRPSKPEDIPALRSLAGVSHRDTRFFFDPNFPRGRCVELYQTWIEKSCNGYADAVLVAELDSSVVGYITCKLLGDGRGQIGLVGVGARVQGRGIGQGLVKAGLGWFAERGADQVIVVSQGRNISAQRLYQRCGFLTQSVQLWYHRHRTEF
jgi:dTDP-4-amino-4,6-dideoxy-D-galactose acyltransferase